MSKCVLPTSQKPTGRQSTETLRSRPRSLSRSRPAKSYRQAKSPPGCNLLRRTEQSTEKSTEKSTGKVYHVDQDSSEAAYRKRNQKSTVKSTKPVRILLKPPFESATMKSTGWSPKRTFKDDYRVTQHL